MIKVVLANGTFLLSDEAVNAFQEGCKKYEPDVGPYSKWDVKHGRIPRHHPVLIEVLETLGEKALGKIEPIVRNQVARVDRIEIHGIPEDCKYTYSIEDPDFAYEKLVLNEGDVLLAKAIQFVTDDKLKKEMLDYCEQSWYCERSKHILTYTDVLQIPAYMKAVIYESEDVYQEHLQAMKENKEE